MLYRIENTHSGIVLGDYEAESAAEALDAMARDAGYQDYADLEDRVPSEPGAIEVYPSPEVRG
jgi:hypothetical protein